jgi:HPr kinase/phosphorylase
MHNISHYLGNIHANAVVFNGVGLLIKGDVGVGKTDLSMRLIDVGGILVADDQVHLAYGCDNKINLHMHATPATLGQIAVRGLGVVDNLPHQAQAPCQVVVQLVADAKDLPLAPDIGQQTTNFYGINLPCLWLCPAAASVVVQLKWALARLAQTP